MPRKYVKTGESPEGRMRRLRAFKHNALTGHVCMMQMQLTSICSVNTTTEAAKNLAAEILAKTVELKAALKQRVDEIPNSAE